MTNGPTFRLRVPIQDLLGLVVGYGMAALFFRAFWPVQGLHPALVAPAIGLYAWLGLAMSSPALLSPSRRAAFDRGELAPSHEPAPHCTGPELAWLWIGIYWIILALFVIPSRSSDFGVRDTVLLGVLPCLAVAISRCVKPRSRPEPEVGRRWTRQAAVGVVVTWPLAWICLMILGRTII